MIDVVDEKMDESEDEKAYTSCIRILFHSFFALRQNLKRHRERERERESIE